LNAQGKQFAVRTILENRDRVLNSLSRFLFLASGVGRGRRRAWADWAGVPAVVNDHIWAQEEVWK